MVPIRNFARNVREEETSLNAIPVRSDNKRLYVPVSEWVAIDGT